MNKAEEYWANRQMQNYLDQEKDMKKFFDSLVEKMEASKRAIEKEINDFYTRYMIANDINSLAEARMLLSKAELGDLKDFIAKVNEHMGEYDLEVENMSIKARITRLQGLQMRIDAILQETYGIGFEATGKDLLREVYANSFYKTMYNLDIDRGIHQAFSSVNIRAVEQLVDYPFNGANFSERLWKHKEHLQTQLNESLTQALIQGKNPKVLAKEFATKVNTKEDDAYRLIQTEASYITEQAAQKAYEEDGIEQYQWIATLDLKTCPLCQPLDKEIFAVKDKIVGVNCPPKHPRCRCTTAPYFEDISNTGTRAARRQADKKTEYVPANLSYAEWRKRYVNETKLAEDEYESWTKKKMQKYHTKDYKDMLEQLTPSEYKAMHRRLDKIDRLKK